MLFVIRHVSADSRNGDKAVVENGGTLKFASGNYKN